MRRLLLTILFRCLLIETVYGASDTPENFTRFVFTQEWPQTTCIMGKMEGKGCLIPNNIRSFIIHGLWPSDATREGPINCSGPGFDPSLVKNITTELNNAWPNLFTKTPKTDFWRHEWLTHGRCATLLPATGSEYLFFRRTLDLMKQYNVTRYLNQAKIVPGKNYTATDITTALKKELGVIVSVMCLIQKKAEMKHKGTLILAEIRICMTTKFELVSCNTKDTTLYFKPRKSKGKDYIVPCSYKKPFLFPMIKG